MGTEETRVFDRTTTRVEVIENINQLLLSIRNLKHIKIDIEQKEDGLYATISIVK